MKALSAPIAVALLAMIALVAGPPPGLATGSPTTPAIAFVASEASREARASVGSPSSTAKACAKGFVHALIGGQHKCLKRGQRCTRAFDRQYHRYRFHCHAGRLSGGASTPKRPAPPTGAPEIDGIVRIKVPGSAPDSIAIAEGAVWVGYNTSSDVARVDPGTNRVVASVRMPYPACGIAASSGTLWAPHCRQGLEAGLSRIDTTSNTLVTTITTPPARAPSVGFGGLWLYVRGAADRGEVWRIDLASGAVVAKIVGTADSGTTAYAAGSAWASAAGGILRVDPGTNTATHIATSSDSIKDLAGDETAVWALPEQEARIFRINPATNTVTSFPLPQAVGPRWANTLAVGGGSVWARVGQRQIARLDPATGRVVGTITAAPLGSYVGALRFGFGSLWAVLPFQNELLRIAVR